MACQPGGSPRDSSARSGRPEAELSAAAAAAVLSLCCSLRARFTFWRQSPASGWKLAFSAASPVASCLSRHSSASLSLLRSRASGSNSSLSAASLIFSASRSASRTACHFESSLSAAFGSFRDFFFAAGAFASFFGPSPAEGFPLATSGCGLADITGAAPITGPLLRLLVDAFGASSVCVSGGDDMRLLRSSAAADPEVVMADDEGTGGWAASGSFAEKLFGGMGASSGGGCGGGSSAEGSGGASSSGGGGGRGSSGSGGGGSAGGGAAPAEPIGVG
mmetsp:Transcript_19349/g.46141  ORF Transcript_19349/g.46141 Transcript_19349/m.46141 type:complete len:277 (-) Transcript_19349:4-834(-)